MEGLPQEAVCVQVTRILALYCILTAPQEVPQVRASSEQKDETKDPLTVSGTEELLLAASIVAVVAVLFSEFIKMTAKRARRYFKKETRLRRLRELARPAAEEELERFQLEGVSACEVPRAV